MKPGSLPTLNMPLKSHNKETKTRRKITKVFSHEENKPKKTYVYESFLELTNRIQSLKISSWFIKYDTDRIVLKMYEDKGIVPKYQVCIDDSLGYSISVYNWILPDDYPLYTKNKRSIKYITISNLLTDIAHYPVCEGLSVSLESQHTVNHVIPMTFDPLAHDDDENTSPYLRIEYCRSLNCSVISSSNQCEHCKKAQAYVLKVSRRKIQKLNTPAKPNAPVSKTMPDRLKLTLREQRLKCKQMEYELEKIRQEIATNSVTVDKDISDDFISIIDREDVKMTPFMKQFWQEQKKMLSVSTKGVRYHPMMIRFFLSIHNKSSSTYKEFRDALGRKNGGILTLPCKKSLRDYNNWIRPKCGFNDDVILELIEITDKYFGVQKYTVLLFDEMKIRANLVYDKVTDELIGFVDLGDPDVNFATLDKINELATHALLFIVRGLATDLCFNFAYFATKGATSYQLFPLFWEAVGILELTVGLAVIGTCCDGASLNRRFIRLHKGLDQGANKDVVYRTLNVYCPDRFIYFFLMPHIW